MPETISYKHWAGCGDLIAAMPGMQHLHQTTGNKAVIFQRLDVPTTSYPGAERPIMDFKGRQVGMNEQTFLLMEPLLLSQPYIAGFMRWCGEKTDIDLDKIRENAYTPMPNGDIHHWQWLSIPQMACDLSIPWIAIDFGAPSPPPQQHIVLNLTSRFRNPIITYNFLKPRENDLAFVGTRPEHADFCNTYGLHGVRYLHADNFLQLAGIIAASKLFIGNQSFCWHLADAMKKLRVLEICPTFPNTWPTGADGYAAMHQDCMEYYVNTLMTPQ